VQLGAHRLGCDRAFVSFIDRKYQWVVCEITRSHSLVEKKHAPNESMFLGVTKLDACWGVCPTTMNAFMDETGAWVQTGPNVIANRTRYIINDFTTEPGYTERPYVVNYPYFRSYLEVPLVSPLGYLLGSYCVVHNDLKEYDNDETVDIMNEIAAAIMAHLELRRIQQSRDRSEQLIQGLSGFINYGSPAEEAWPIESAPPSKPQHPVHSAVTASGSDEPSALGSRSWDNPETPSWSDVSPDMDLAGYPRPSLNHASSSLESYETVSSPLGNNGSNETPPTTPREELDEDPFARLVSVGAAAVNEDDDRRSVSETTELFANGFISSANIKSTLYRAAVTIRKSMNMDGFMFLDAVPSSFADRSDQLAFDEQRDISREEVIGPFSAAIVQSTAGGSGERPSQPSQPSQTRLPEVALQRFIKRFPHGHIFSADEFGPIDEIYAPGKAWPTARDVDEDRILRHDISTLFRVLPTAKYVVFRPLWHFQQECWYAAAVGWVEDPTRAIDLSDIGLVSAFGNSVMAEVSRLEALATSRAKSDFVSSISHELRSPLHGIMAGSELLREGVAHNPMLVSTLDMLDSCGTTLLDIFNNLLEHAIVTTSGGRYQSTMANVRIADLAGLVEDVLDVVHTSHLSENAFQSAAHRKGSFAVEPLGIVKTRGQRPLLVTLNIGKKDSWKIPANTGAWKRIVMNIFGNALKYTSSGRIQVTLKDVQRPDKSGKMCAYISFSVQDTGRGMSSDYLKYKLFMPFSQENTLSPGMGLGLSIVQQLASGLGGTVDVKSSVGVGTLVEVLIPARNEFDGSPALSAVVEHDRPSYDDQRQLLSGRTVCVITPDAYAAMADTCVPVSNSQRKRSAVVEQAIKANAGVTLGMDVVIATAECPNPPADVYIIDALILNKSSTLSAAGVSPAKYTEFRPLVVLCAGAGPAPCQRHDILEGQTFHLHHPLGPRKLASVLCSAMEAVKQSGIHEDRPETPDTTLAMPVARVASTSTTLLPARPMQEAVSSTSVSEAHVAPRPPLPGSHSTAATTNAQPHTTQHLLLVDDNPINVKLLATCVTRLHHTFRTACNGLEAVQLYADSLNGSQPAFDMIFMDISMPVMDGFEATRQIRSLEAQVGGDRRCKIVALTGLSSEESRDEALASGSDVFLTKPVKLDRVRRVLDEELGGHVPAKDGGGHVVGQKE
jgi:signal transduction histidine kinase/ActR/RegA family two-component response regulator